MHIVGRGRVGRGAAARWLMQLMSSARHLAPLSATCTVFVPRDAMPCDGDGATEQSRGLEPDRPELYISPLPIIIVSVSLSPTNLAMLNSIS